MARKGKRSRKAVPPPSHRLVAARVRPPQALGIAQGAATPARPADRLTARRGLLREIFDPVNKHIPDASWRNTNLASKYNPAQFVAAPAKTEVVRKTPQKQSALKIKEPAQQSPQARDKKKHCKQRPEGHNPRRAGGGASKDYVPWCDK